MVPSASKNHASLHGKTYGWKNCRNKEVNHPIPKPWYHLKEGCHLMLNNPGEHSAASDFNATLHGYVTIPTSGNIGGWFDTGCDYIICMAQHENVATWGLCMHGKSAFLLRSCSLLVAQSCIVVSNISVK